MPPALHPHLKRRLDFEDLYTTSDDVNGGLSPNHHDPQARQAKQRRVEAIASQYLEGKAPLILSAALRGPFGNGWKNPWTRNTPESGIYAPAEINRPGVRSTRAGRKKSKYAVSIEAKIETPQASKTVSLSPEVPRNAHDHLATNWEEDNSDEIEVMPATAPSQERHENSSTSAFPRPDVDEYTQSEPRLANPFWLHRAKSGRRDTKMSGKPDKSPTRAELRDKNLKSGSKQDLQLAPPKPLPRNQLPSPESAFLNDCKSGAPATTSRAPRHDLVASPAPTSSTGFIYRKFERAKQVGRNASNTNTTPQYSSSAGKKDLLGVKKRSPQKEPGLHETKSFEEKLLEQEPEGRPVHSMDQETLKASSSALLDELNGSLNDMSHRSSQQPIFSTQAAIMLAQAQFLECSSSPTSSQAHRPWSQYQRDTPQPEFPEPSPPITPVAFFSAQLDKSLPRNTVLRGPPMSTQDLLGAISPFTFSTARKKTAGPVRSSLRLSLNSGNGDQSRTSGLSGKSPTPSTDRIPLKVKNVSTPLWSFVSEKASQDSLVDRSVVSNHESGLPPINCSAILDKPSPNTDLRLSDQFFHQLYDT